MLSLPPFEGFLPQWLVLVSVVSAANSLQAYRSEAYAAELYNGRTPEGYVYTNPLSSRTFGTWTFLSAVIRFYAAYNINNPAVYDLALWTFGIALVHFVGELVKGSARLRGRFVSPLLVASSTLTWMFWERAWYLGA
ncbi:Erg28 family protein [Aspergillus aculeatinus CBS 121060]|uniref:Ergosterol 28 n=3 Tax=Aspergillus TaxID=5052 RepID=A0A8G1RI16_9EURO|nr:ergosterol 28 [Aspergillus brunneoviolaceus CBS 621.78]XP_025497606.1 ergosterol 28 [Aspergillus aculeatinus CBS 121060]XP_040796157.1 ergosterol 28 [Aspergillus fijiensis CBS 313.89]RAH45679.1 ergosterol 28 [Aspergillus brunneoviolaceus CBS 621.78]RAH63783.1 ergosterol 28 [Aspergillus aculeatinus CBS 121060]RAK72145.1 ergosterol 28 [Aspergillus fijiensis CBS 313.89]